MARAVVNRDAALWLGGTLHVVATHQLDRRRQGQPRRVQRGSPREVDRGHEEGMRVAPDRHERQQPSRDPVDERRVEAAYQGYGT